MSRSDKNEYMSHRCWPIGLLLVMAFLGHDLLMATESSAAPYQRPALDLHVSHDAVNTDDFARESGQSQPDHPESCDVVRRVVPRNADETSLLNFTKSTMSAPITYQVALIHAVTSTMWQEPPWPPGAMRSFLQVYRI